MGSRSRYIAEFAITGNDIVNGSLTVADLSTIYTDNVTEAGNLFFTDTRARNALVQGPGITYNPANGQIAANITSISGLATTTYVDNSVAALVSSAPAALDTLNELAAALNDDSDFSNTIITLIGTKANTTALDTLTTANVAEATNLYFTNARARAAISVTGSGTYDEITGVITVTGGVESVNGQTGNVTITAGVESVNGQTGNVTIGSGILLNRYTYTIAANAQVIAGLDDSNVSLNLTSPESVTVYVNGILLTPTSDYTLNTTHVVFATNVLSGSTVTVIQGLAKLSNVVSSGSTSKYTYAGNLDQTIFSGADQLGKTLVLTDPSNVHVFLNGILLTPTADYTAFTGNITLTTGAPADSTLTVIDNMVSVLTNAVTNINGLSGNVELTTANIAESGNLYFTEARARQSIIVSGSGTYDQNTGIITILGAVESVNNATGNVTLTTANIAESGNLYFTQARARESLSVTGAGSYDNSTGIITITGGVTSVNGQTGAVSLSTSNVAEGANLYFSNDRVYANVVTLGYATENFVSNALANLVNSAPAALDTLNELAAAINNDNAFSTTVINLIATKANATVVDNLTTSNIAEGANLYYSNSRVIDVLYAEQPNIFSGAVSLTRYIYTSANNQSVFSGADDNNNTLFLLHPERALVYLNGILLTRDTDYTAYATNVTIAENLTDNNIVSVLVGGTIDSSYSFITSKRYVYSIASNTTVLTGADDNSQTLNLTYPDRTHVFVNGILLLPTTDYMAYTSNITFTDNVLVGSTVVLVDNLSQVFGNVASEARAALGAEDSSIIYYTGNGKIKANVTAVTQQDFIHPFLLAGM